MLTILFRTIIIYIFLLIIMRLMGKRQIGELEISDLVTTFLLSEIASLPITDTNIPVAFAIIPMVILLTFEVSSSWILSRFPFFKNFLSARPATLISNGKINRKEMLAARLSLDELIGELRQNGISDISEVRYAILEQNGKITVIQKEEKKPISAEKMKIEVCDSGMDRIIISDGYINRHSLRALKMSRADVEKILKSKKIEQKDIYLMLIDDAKNVKIFRKDGK
ncbi:MAG: DUF421 domain-containing protein [Clostridia bacterium]|nr:DUF421 domain-containing protein [Clostridia bacterium]